MPTLVVDTHALVWHLTDPTRLGKGARRAFGAVDSGRWLCHVPAITLVEIQLLQERGRLRAGPSQTLELLAGHPGYAVLGLDVPQIDPATGTFADAVSLQFPPKLEAGPERPYFLRGDSGAPVYLLGWEAGKGAVEATASGPDKVSPLRGSEATAKVVFDKGQYRLVLKRPLGSPDGDRLSFEPARFTPVAVQAWDGGAGETGTKMSLTSWYYLRLDEPESKRRFVVPPLVALATLAAMVLVVRAANRRS